MSNSLPEVDKKYGERHKSKSRESVLSKIILRYPLYGILTRTTDKGFGFVKSTSKEFFVHILDLKDAPGKTLEGLEGRPCAFVLGGHPFNYINSKSNWKDSVVEWVLLDESEQSWTELGYGKIRQEMISSLDFGQWNDVLGAAWYKSRWKKLTPKEPQALLRTDADLIDAIHVQLANCPDLRTLLRLLDSVISSPMFGLTIGDQHKVIERFFRPDEWPLASFVSNQEYEVYKLKSRSWLLLKDSFQKYIALAEVVSIDLESNGRDVFQYGWKNGNGIGIKKSPPGTGLSHDELQSAVSESVHTLMNPCLVGHNFIKWDWPILLKWEIDFPLEFRIWDTMIVSWLLEPWKKSHALVVKENAHQADADAVATYAMFEEQHLKLAPYLNGKVVGTQDLVNILHEQDELLSLVEGRTYPETIQHVEGQSSLYPSSHRAELEWQVGCFIDYESPEKKSFDPVLTPAVCLDIASEKGCMYSMAVALIVADAYLAQVQVRLSMIPLWLIAEDDDLRTILREQNFAAAEEFQANDTYYLTGDIFRLEISALRHWASSRSIKVLFPEVVINEWNNAYCAQLSDQQFDREHPGVLERVRNRTLLSVGTSGDGREWLLRDSIGLMDGQGPWKRIPTRPKWLTYDTGRGPSLRAIKLAKFPRWKDGSAKRLDVDRLFVSPDTDNRMLYVADFLHCVLNLALKGGDDFLIVAMRWPGEAEKLENHLSQLSYTSRKSESPLRQIEYLVDHNLKIAVCSIDRLREYLEGARAKGVTCQIVVDEIPLHHWYCILHDPNESASKTQIENYSEATAGKIPAFELKDQDVWRGLDTFVDSWLRANLPVNYELDYPALIFDARIYDRPVGKRRDLPWRSCSFYPIEELLNEEQQDIYYEFCFTRKPYIDVPNSYDEYRAFLSKVWGYPDFREGPQQEAIRALLANNNDLLLRLPTGGGKSIVFHLPALLRSSYTGRLTVVITPLRALMADQVHGLWDKQFTESVDYLSGGRDPVLNQGAYRGILDGRVKLIFVAPERFRVSRFVEALERRRRLDGGLEFVVFDEVHCVSEWGFEFRPDYLYAAQYIAKWFKEKELPGNPHRLLLTSATVTQRTRSDLKKELGLGATGPYSDLPEEMPHPIQPFIVLESDDLVMNDEDPASDPRTNRIIEIIEGMDLQISAVIVFVRRRKDCHRISEYLNEYSDKNPSDRAPLLSLPFHAGLPESVKEETCVMLQERRVNVLVCTKAFGMGMDIPHLHACVHYQAPSYVEDYLQEVGRIGRDEKERKRANKELVRATLLYSRDDMESSIGMLQDKAIRPPDLQTFMEYLAEKVVHFPAVQKYVGLVPPTLLAKDAKKFDETQVTTCLFWLSRAGILTVEGRHPPFIDLTVKKVLLREISTGETVASRISSAILNIISDSISVISEQLESGDHSGIKSRESSGSESAFGRFVRGLKRGFLALISIPPPSVYQDTDDTPSAPVIASEEQSDSVTISVSTSELLGAVGGIGMDDLIEGLFELKKAQAVSINRNFPLIELGKKSSEYYVGLLEHTVARLLSPTKGSLKRESRQAFKQELEKWYLLYLNSETVSVYSVRKDTSHKANDDPESPLKFVLFEVDDIFGGRSEIKVGYLSEQREKLLELVQPVLRKPKGGPVEVLINRTRSSAVGFDNFLLTGVQSKDSKLPIPITRQNKNEVFRALKTSLRLLRYCGLEIKESLSSKGVTTYSRTVSRDESFSLSKKAMDYQDQLKTLVEFCDERSSGSGKTFDVQLGDMLSVFDRPPRYSRLTQLLKLMETSGFYGIEGSADDWHSVVSLNSLKALPNHDPEWKSSEYSGDKVRSVYAEMVDKHRLKELRAQSMVLLTVMPAENRKNFIDAYFESQTGDEIEQLLENVVGDVDDAVIQENEILQEILAHVRQERFDDEINRLNFQQKAVCTAPFRDNLLVNAGPGSGKTHVLMMRCAHLIHKQGINPRRVLVLAFNRAVVFEIRRRIRDLFRALGYGSYVNKLDVTTFHSFALRFQEVDDQFQQEAIEDGVHKFALKMKADEEFAKNLANNYQAVLVDEFQDMNEDFYNVVDALAIYNAGGTMVIGDDDQDILAWNRRNWRNIHGMAGPLEAIEYFSKFESEYAPQKYQLLLNYRSVPQIVRRSNAMIAKVAETIGFQRMKSGVLLDANRTEEGSEQNYKTWDEGLHIAVDAWRREEDVAVFCRSNRECRKAYENLVNLGVNREQVGIIGGTDLSLYQLRSYGALMDIIGQLDQYVFIDQYVWDRVIKDYVSLKHAGSELDKCYLERLYELIKKEQGRPRAKDLFDFIRETKLSDLERLKSHHGMKGWEDFEEEAPAYSITVSTIHKVKGLEFETVVILPSAEKFPMSNAGRAEIVDSAEEARLFYVAMTRARDRLFVGWGKREASWYKCHLENAQAGAVDGILEGAPDEVFVSWPGQSRQVEGGIQQRIQDVVCDGAIIKRRNKELLHDGVCIGRLSRKGLDKIEGATQFRVAHVMRYNCGQYMKMNNGDFWDKLHADIKRHEWCYTVLVENI